MNSIEGFGVERNHSRSPKIEDLDREGQRIRLLKKIKRAEKHKRLTTHVSNQRHSGAPKANIIQAPYHYRPNKLI